MQHGNILLWVLLSASGVVDVDQACMDCHAVNAQHGGAVPLISGQPEAFLRARLATFAEQHEGGFPMTTLAEGLTESQIAEIAETLSHQAFVADRQPVLARRASRGEQRWRALGCATCHGTAYEGEGNMPRLAGQRRSVLERRLQQLRDGEAHPLGDSDEKAQPLEERDVLQIASYLHSLGQRRPASADPGPVDSGEE